MSTRTFLITGASEGIGRAVACQLLEEGHRVVGIARDFSAEPLAVDGFRPRTMDLGDLGRLPGRLESLARDYPEIDGLVCNAGRGRFGSLEEFSHEQISELVDLNLTSQIHLLRVFLPRFKSKPHADVVLMGSEAALTGGKRGAVYAATKAALRGLARALREECSRSGVRVSLINPGAVRTGFYRDAPFRPGPSTDNALEPEDVAKAVCGVLGSRPGVVFDEVNLSPLKKVLEFGKGVPRGGSEA